MSADLLRRAAAALRNPELCNWDGAAARATADLLERHAYRTDRRVRAERDVGVAEGATTAPEERAAVALARALLTSFGLNEADVQSPPTVK